MTAILATGLTTAAHADPACCTIVELRQYDMKPNGRDTLIELFDGIFVDGQEAAGATIMGQFRDLDRPDRFVWLRGFKDLTSRPVALNAFYTSALWQKHRDAANVTMVDVSNVLLLHPLAPASGLPIGKRPKDEAATGIVEVAIYAFDAAVDASTIAGVDRDLTIAGAKTIASYVSEKSANNYPRLPIRENENVLVRIATFPSIQAYETHRATMAASPQWQSAMQRIRQQLKADPHILRLTPTRRSLTHG